MSRPPKKKFTIAKARVPTALSMIIAGIVAIHKGLTVTLGRPEQWLCFSDHVPLIVEVEM
jgi:hypothetical protein